MSNIQLVLTESKTLPDTHQTVDGHFCGDQNRVKGEQKLGLDPYNQCPKKIMPLLMGFIWKYLLHGLTKVFKCTGLSENHIHQKDENISLSFFTQQGQNVLYGLETRLL